VRALFDRRFLLSLLAAISVCFFLWPIRATAQQPQDQGTSSDALMTNFYKDPRPERLIGFFEKFQTLPAAQNWQAYPPVAGFLAFVFRANPSQVGKLIPARLDAKGAETIAAALRLSGSQSIPEDIRSRLQAAGRDEQLAAQLANLPPRLEDIRITIPSHLDILWGAAFASGDGIFAQMIIDYFAQTANLSEPIAVDIARTVVAMMGGPKEILGELRGRYGDQVARQIIFAATALWAVQSNARQHAFIERVVAKYIADHPGTPAQKALVSLRPRHP
jgi:hypothetical protein